MRKVLLLGLAAASLSACDRLPFGGVESPHRKPGYWEQTRQSDRDPAPTLTKWCFDAASDRQFPILGRRRRGAAPAALAAACSPVQTTKTGDSYVTDIKCNMAGVTRNIHTVTSGDFGARYTTTTTFNVQGDPNPARNGQHSTTMTAVYKGACPPELSPGQMEGPDGAVVDMAQLRGGQGFGRGPTGGGPAGGGGGGGGQ
jgi:hypothetical protein